MIYSINNEEQYQKALEYAYSLFNSELNSLDGKELNRVVDLIIEYEEKIFLIDKK